MILLRSINVFLIWQCVFPQYGDGPEEEGFSDLSLV